MPMSAAFPSNHKWSASSASWLGLGLALLAVLAALAFGLFVYLNRQQSHGGSHTDGYEIEHVYDKANTSEPDL